MHNPIKIESYYLNLAFTYKDSDTSTTNITIKPTTVNVTWIE